MLCWLCQLLLVKLVLLKRRYHCITILQIFLVNMTQFFQFLLLLSSVVENTLGIIWPFNDLYQSSFAEGLDLVKEAIDKAEYNGRIKLAVDVAATEFCIGKKYDLDFKTHNKSGQIFKTGEDMIEIYTRLCTDYSIVSIEQPFDKDDWDTQSYSLTLEFARSGMLCEIFHIKIDSAPERTVLQIVDLLMSNPKRIERAISESTCNALLLKINPIGTVTEAIEVVKQAKDAHWGVVASHRSGETEDYFIADQAVGLATGQMKAGAPCHGERLLRIEEELGSEAKYAGENWRLL